MKLTTTIRLIHCDFWNENLSVFVIIIIHNSNLLQCIRINKCGHFEQLTVLISQVISRKIPVETNLRCKVVPRIFLPVRRSKRGMLQQRGWVAGWLGGWVSVTRRYCIKTAKPLLRLFQPSGSPIIQVSSDPFVDTQFQGEPLQRGR